MRARLLWIASIIFLIAQIDPSHAAPRDRFYWLSRINRASAVMIVERGIVPKPLGKQIFDAINRVDTDGDAPGAARSGDYLRVEQDLVAGRWPRHHAAAFRPQPPGYRRNHPAVDHARRFPSTLSSS